MHTAAWPLAVPGVPTPRAERTRGPSAARWRHGAENGARNPDYRRAPAARAAAAQEGQAPLMSDYPVTRGARPGDPHLRLRLAALTAVIIGVILVALAAFLLSYTGIHQIALQAGVSAGLARLYPLMFDAMLVITCSAVLATRTAGWGTKVYVWVCLLLVVGAVAVGDALYATGVHLTGQAARATIAVVPWVLLLLGFGVWLVMLRHWRRIRMAGAVNGAEAGRPAQADRNGHADRPVPVGAGRAARPGPAGRAGRPGSTGHGGQRGRRGRGLLGGPPWRHRGPHPHPAGGDRYPAGAAGGPGTGTACRRGRSGGEPGNRDGPGEAADHHAGRAPASRNHGRDDGRNHGGGGGSSSSRNCSGDRGGDGGRGQARSARGYQARDRRGDQARDHRGDHAGKPGGHQARDHARSRSDYGHDRSERHAGNRRHHTGDRRHHTRDRSHHHARRPQGPRQGSAGTTPGTAAGTTPASAAHHARNRSGPRPEPQRPRPEPQPPHPEPQPPQPEPLIPALALMPGSAQSGRLIPSAPVRTAAARTRLGPGPPQAPGRPPGGTGQRG